MQRLLRPCDSIGFLRKYQTNVCCCCFRRCFSRTSGYHHSTRLRKHARWRKWIFLFISVGLEFPICFLLGAIVSYLLRIAKVLVIGMRYYPAFAAVYIDSTSTLLCATLYAWFDFSFSIIQQSRCQSDFYPTEANFIETNGTDIARFFRFYGTGQNLVAIQLCKDIPRYICWSYIVIKLPLLLIRRKYPTEKHENTDSLRLTREEKVLLHSSAPHSIEMSYVRNLFRLKEHRSTSRYFIGRLLPKFLYEWRDDFRFSSRVICLYASVFLLLF